MSQDTSPSASATGSPAPIAEVSRYRNLPPIGQTILMVSAVGSVLASIYIIFGIGNLVKANSPRHDRH